MERGLQKRINTLTVLNVLILIFVVLISFSRTTSITSTPVTTIKGDDGSNGVNGIDGQDSLSYLRTVELIKQAPGIDGKNAEPCKTLALETGTSIECPGSPATFIPTPENGKDGRTSMFQVNQETCMLQHKYSDNRTWVNLIRDPDCEVSSGT